MKWDIETQLLLREEIEAFEMELSRFNITFNDLVESGPKHHDTRAKAKDIGVKTSEIQEFTEHLYTKKRLPISKMCLRFNVSRKIINISKQYITSIVVVFYKKFELIKNGYKKR